MLLATASCIYLVGHGASGHGLNSVIQQCLCVCERVEGQGWNATWKLQLENCMHVIFTFYTLFLKSSSPAAQLIIETTMYDHA